MAESHIVCCLSQRTLCSGTSWEATIGRCNATLFRVREISRPFEGTFSLSALGQIHRISVTRNHPQFSALSPLVVWEPQGEIDHILLMSFNPEHLGTKTTVILFGFWEPSYPVQELLKTPARTGRLSHALDPKSSCWNMVIILTLIRLVIYILLIFCSFLVTLFHHYKAYDYNVPSPCIGIFHVFSGPDVSSVSCLPQMFHPDWTLSYVM